jgi:hypothetical protein
MGDPVLKEDLWDVRNTLNVLLSNGFSGINLRLDQLNGRTRKVENVTAVHSWAIGLMGAGYLALFAWLLTKLH